MIIDADEAAGRWSSRGARRWPRSAERLRGRHPRADGIAEPCRPSPSSRSPTRNQRRGAQRHHVAGDASKRSGARIDEAPADAIVVCDVAAARSRRTSAEQLHTRRRSSSSRRRIDAAASTASGHGACARDDGAAPDGGPEPATTSVGRTPPTHRQRRRRRPTSRRRSTTSGSSCERLAETDARGGNNCHTSPLASSGACPRSRLRPCSPRATSPRRSRRSRRGVERGDRFQTLLGITGLGEELHDRRRDRRRCNGRRSCSRPTRAWPRSSRASSASCSRRTGSSTSSPTTTTTSPRRTSRPPTPTSRRTRRSTTRSTGSATRPPARSCRVAT